MKRRSELTRVSTSSSLATVRAASLTPSLPSRLSCTSHFISLVPLVSAKAWSVVEPKKGDLLWGKNAKSELKIASLTKIMTCYVALNVLQRLRVTPHEFIITVSKRAAAMCGTSARLRAGDSLSVVDLLHGLMLPSGNDAAVALAESLGLAIFRLDFREKHHKTKVPAFRGDPLAVFVREMNKTARSFNLKYTYFTNPHGLSDPAPSSTAEEVGRMAARVLRDPLLKQIVSRADYKCLAQTEEGESREYVWSNTNILLRGGDLA